MAKELDEYQKKAVNVLQNAVVSAGAGSGKTTVLSERFLNLVQMKNGCNVDEILTLTFTKKATVEMSSRIYKVLKENAPAQAANFFKANIKTLDSYCNSVAKLGCHFYGISPDFTQDEESIRNQAFAKALPFILKHRDNLAIKKLVNTNDYAEIAKELFVNPILKNSFIAEPINFDAAFAKQIDAIYQAWEKNAKHTGDLLNQLVGLYNDYSGNRNTEFINALKFYIEDNELPGTVSLSKEEIEAADSKNIELYTTVINQIASISFPKGKASDQLVSIKEVLSEIRSVRDTLVSICNFVSGYSITKEVIPLLKEFQEEVNQIKRSSGLLSFGDISNMALCILRDHPEIRAIEKNRYKYIMIDEFQDNNKMQRDMLFLLAEKPERMEKGIPDVSELCPEKLFFVGDEKQSIYLFRGAEVEVFRGLSNDFKDGNLQMTTNFRSHQALIASFNTIFGGLAYPPEKFTKQKQKDTLPSVFYTNSYSDKDSIPNYEAIYNEVTISKTATEEVENAANLMDIYKPHIHFAFYSSEQEADPTDLTGEEAEAQWVGQEIKKLIANGKRPSDIAILMRNYTLQALYERTLLNLGIPYNTETVKGFYSDGPINDIMAFLKLCAYPTDTISYAQILRSPFVNLSIAETTAILALKKKPFECGSEELLMGQSLEIFKAMQDFYKEISQTAQYEPLSTTITKLWYTTGYRYETMWNNTVEMYSKLYDLLFELARTADQDNMSLSAFVDMVDVYRDESKKLEGMDIPLDQTAGVHILSIHKSKGLEYDTVFIIGSHKSSKNDTNSSPIYSSKEYGVSINTPPCKSFANSKSQYFYNLAKEEKTNKENAELRRVVYVALTRAKTELYITAGKYKASKDSSVYLPGGDGNPNSILKILEPIIDFYGNSDNNLVSPFDIQEIPPYPRFAIPEDSVQSTRRNTLSDKKLLINDILADNPYTKLEAAGNVITKDILKSKYTNPSKLHGPDDENSVYQIKNDKIAFPAINEIVESTIPADEKRKQKENPQYVPIPRFGYNNFGTIAHAYMEAAINKTKPDISNKEWVGLENNQQNIDKIRQICEEMTEIFENSEIGQAAIKSTEHHAEYEFRSRVADKIVKGVIDLVFKNEDGTYTILDYKTNQTEQPEIYYNQLACYRQAIAQMLNISDVNTIKCYLFYLRSGHQIDITDECSKVDLIKAVQQIQ